MPQTYFYIIQSESGESIVEYDSLSPPALLGRVLNLKNITSNHGHVEVINVERLTEVDHTLVRVTVKPVLWQHIWPPEGGR